MSRSILLFCLALSPLFAAVSGHAADPADVLYTSNAIVTGKGEKNRRLGFRDCLDRVLVRVSGDQRLLARPEVAAMRDNAGDLVASFDYRDLLEGIPIHDEQGEFLGFRGTGADLPEARYAEAEVRRLARHDSLTGLFNRSAMTKALDEALRTGRGQGTPSMASRQSPGAGWGWRVKILDERRATSGTMVAQDSPGGPRAHVEGAAGEPPSGDAAAPSAPAAPMSVSSTMRSNSASRPSYATGSTATRFSGFSRVT